MAGGKVLQQKSPDDSPSHSQNNSNSPSPQKSDGKQSPNTAKDTPLSSWRRNIIYSKPAKLEQQLKNEEFWVEKKGDEYAMSILSEGFTQHTPKLSEVLGFPITMFVPKQKNEFEDQDQDQDQKNSYNYKDIPTSFPTSHLEDENTNYLAQLILMDPLSGSCITKCKGNVIFMRTDDQPLETKDIKIFAKLLQKLKPIQGPFFSEYIKTALWRVQKTYQKVVDENKNLNQKDFLEVVEKLVFDKSGNVIQNPSVEEKNNFYDSSSSKNQLDLVKDMKNVDLVQTELDVLEQEFRAARLQFLKNLSTTKDPKSILPPKEIIGKTDRYNDMQNLFLLSQKVKHNIQIGGSLDGYSTKPHGLENSDERGPKFSLCFDDDEKNSSTSFEYKYLKKLQEKDANASGSKDDPDTAAPSCGLLNIGNTCFMASAVQCLLHCTPLRKYFRRDWEEHLNEKNFMGSENCFF